MDEPVAVQLRVVPVVPDNTPAVYANFVTVNKSLNEYFLTFCLVRLRPDMTPDASGSIPAVAQVQIVLPHDVGEGLVDALQKQMGAILAPVAEATQEETPSA